jgi:hypothetical protein
MRNLVRDTDFHRGEPGAGRTARKPILRLWGADYLGWLMTTEAVSRVIVARTWDGSWLPSPSRRPVCGVA